MGFTPCSPAELTEGLTVFPTPQLHFICQFMEYAEFFTVLANTLYIYIFMYISIYHIYISIYLSIYLSIQTHMHNTFIHIHTYRQTDPPTYIQTDRQTDRQTDMHMDIQTYRHIYIQTYIHMYVTDSSFLLKCL